MRKLHLDPDALVVQSFPTEEVDARRGTVRGMDATVDQDTCNTCDRCTDVDTCPAGTCAASCLASCASCPLSCNPAQCPSADGRC
jgi:flavoprotein